MNLQIEYLLALQNFRDLTNGNFDWLFEHITMFGQYLIPTMILALLYWFIDKKCAVLMIWCISLSMLINQFLKSTFCIYRPWFLDSRINPVSSALPLATGYSFPSGHTALATAYFGTIAAYWKNKILRYSLITLILLVAFSRNYLGVHTPQDVVVSIAIGAGLIFVIPHIQKWVDGGKSRDAIAYFAILVLSAFLILYTELKSYPVDYINGVLLVDPDTMKIDAYPKVGFLLGFFSGWIIDRKFINFTPEQKFSIKNLIYGIIGFAVICFLLSVPVSITAYGNTLSPAHSIFISFFMTGIFITAGYPALIKDI